MKGVELGVDLGSKSQGSEIPAPSGEYFPEIHFEESSPCPIPEEGLLTVSFRLIKHSEDSRNEDNKKYGYTIQILKLVSAVSEELEAPSKRYNESEDALDKLAAEKSKESEY